MFDKKAFAGDNSRGINAVMSFPKAHVRPEVLPAIEVNKPLAGVDPVHRQVSPAAMSAHDIAPYHSAGVGYRAYVVAQSGGGAEQDNADVGGAARGRLIEEIKATLRKYEETGKVPEAISAEPMPCADIGPNAEWAKLDCNFVNATAIVSSSGENWDIEVTFAAQNYRLIPSPGAPRVEWTTAKTVTYPRFLVSKTARRS